MRCLVVFDFDGVLVDSAPGIRHSLDEALKSCGMERATHDEERSLLGPPLLDGLTALVRGRGVSAGLVSDLTAAFRSDYAETSLRLTRPYRGVDELLRRTVGRGHRIALATSKPQSATMPLLRHFGFDDLLETVECAGVGETKTDVLGRVLFDAGRFAANAFMIGDRSYDMIAAQHHGIRGLGAGWGYGSPDELLASGAEAVASAPSDVDRLLERPL